MLRGKRFSHDAHVVGRPKEIRGVLLTKALYDEGVFVPLLIGAPCTNSGGEQAQEACDQINNDVGMVLEHDGVELEQTAIRRRTLPRAGKISFFCAQCKQSGDVLYCSLVIVDGVAPELLCSQCKPHEWVNISRADYARVVSEN